MQATTDQLVQVLETYEERMGVEGKSAVATLAYIGLGGMFHSNTKASSRDSEDLIEMISNGSVHDAAVSDLRSHIESLMTEQHIWEDLIVMGVVHHVTARLEEFSEDMSKSRSQSRDGLECQRECLQDPEERAKSARNINRMLPLEVPRVSPDDLLNGLDDLEERYGGPIDLNQMREARQRLEAWKRAVAKVFGSAPNR